MTPYSEYNRKWRFKTRVEFMFESGMNTDQIATFLEVQEGAVYNALAQRRDRRWLNARAVKK